MARPTRQNRQGSCVVIPPVPGSASRRSPVQATKATQRTFRRFRLVRLLRGRSVLTNNAWDPAPLDNVWNPGPLSAWWYGGGTSRLFVQPWWQQNVVPSSIANYFSSTPGRAVPDVALDADPTTGMLVGQTQTWSDGSTSLRHLSARRHQSLVPAVRWHAGARRPEGRQGAGLRQPGPLRSRRNGRLPRHRRLPIVAERRRGGDPREVFSRGSPPLSVWTSSSFAPTSSFPERSGRYPASAFLSPASMLSAASSCMPGITCE